ncbi:4Fe-4S dicluster domain-containing protein [Spirochaetota bacterium]
MAAIAAGVIFNTLDIPFLWIIIFLFTAIISSISHRSFALFLEFSILPFVWLVFGIKDPLFRYITLITAMLVSTSYVWKPRNTAIVNVIICTIITLYIALYYEFERSIVHIVIFTAAWLMVLIHLVNVFSIARGSITSADVIICSYTGNTGHYSNIFIRALEDAGVRVTCHCFHYYKKFKANLSAHALVIAFPVIGWKPPWPMLSFLVSGLPRGKGKPVYIIYSSAGGPENAGVLIWAILTLKGYRVHGRSTAVYAINIPTFRIGPKRLWHWYDELFPGKQAAINQNSYGRSFAQGKKTGLPVILWPTPLVIIGIILENKYINRIYRNHVFKKRCKQCGKCISYCPSERLIMKNGYPKGMGECIICTGCVNICPVNAMHIWCFTEYGRQYQHHAFKKI